MYCAGSPLLHRLFSICREQGLLFDALQKLLLQRLLLLEAAVGSAAVTPELKAQAD